jgi:outer membrane protein OmpA-like peptidoglycan-associated protein
MFSSQDEDQEKRVAFTVLIAVVLAVVSLVIGIGLWKARGAAAAKAPAAPPAAAAPADATAAAAAGATAAKTDQAMTAAAQAAADAASVKVDGAVVKFYFASGKSELPAGGKEALNDIVKGVAAGKKAIISGYVDPSGNAAQNAELAKKRAFAVRDLIQSLGVAADKIELQKPADITAGSTSAAEGRRVEVTLK